MAGTSTQKRLRVTVLVGTMAITAVAGLTVGLRGQEKEPPLDPRIAAYDKGPNKIDVSKYTKEMQDKYKLFSTKCSKCHTLARPINSDYVLEDEWERYVKRMMQNAGTFISADDGKAIYEFLVYDSKIRKKVLYDKKLKEAGRGGGPASSER
jgi:hypothetical protein